MNRSILQKVKNESEKCEDDVEEKMEVDSSWMLKSREEGMMVWMKDEEAAPAFKQEVLQPKPVVKAKKREGESSNCDELVCCGELVWHESTSILLWSTPARAQ